MLLCPGNKMSFIFWKTREFWKLKITFKNIDIYAFKNMESLEK